MSTRRKEEPQSNTSGKGKIKFRYTDEERTVQFSMEGATGELVTEVRSLANVLAGRAIVEPPRRLPDSAGNGSPTPPRDTEVIEHDPSQDSESGSLADDETQDDSEDGKAERRRRIPTEPKVLNDLDITAGSMPLKTFVEQKGPRKAQDRLVVVAVWLKKYKDYDEIGRDHLYTCYQQMGGSGDWKAVNDWDSTLRTLAKRKSWFEKGKSEALFKVTIIASNYVDGMTKDAK